MWEKQSPLLSKAGVNYDIGALLENFTSEGMVIISEARPADYLYRRMLLLGAEGPVNRSQADASYIQDRLKMLRDSGVAPESKESKAKKRAIKKNKKK